MAGVSVRLKTKKYPCFTEAQQEAYNKLLPKQKLYVDNRGKGMSKTDAYKMAGYNEKKANQGSYILERGNAVIAELVNVLSNSGFFVKKKLLDKKSAVNKQIREKAVKQYNVIPKDKDGYIETEDVVKGELSVEDMPVETAQRIKFYSDIISGDIKSVKKIVKYDKDGYVVDTRIEETNDISSRMLARKELDKLLGLNVQNDMTSIQAGNITITFVDASKKSELEDTRNKINLDPDKELDADAVEVNGGEDNGG